MPATDEAPVILTGATDSIDFDQFRFDPDDDRTERALGEPLLVFPEYEAAGAETGDGGTDGGPGPGPDTNTDTNADTNADGDAGGDASPEPVCSGRYTVLSPSDEARTYTVATPQAAGRDAAGDADGTDDATPACSCPDFQHRGVEATGGGCKHIRRVRLLQTVDVLPRHGESGDLWEQKLRTLLADLDDEHADVEQRRAEAEQWAAVVARLRNHLQEHISESYRGP